MKILIKAGPSIKVAAGAKEIVLVSPGMPVPFPFTAIASQAEAEAGTNNTKGMTPLQVSNEMKSRNHLEENNEGNQTQNETGTATIDLLAGGKQKLTAGGAYDITIEFSNIPASGSASLTLDAINFGVASSIIWPVTMETSGGDAFSYTASGKDKFELEFEDGALVWAGQSSEDSQ